MNLRIHRILSILLLSISAPIFSQNIEDTLHIHQGKNNSEHLSALLVYGFTKYIQWPDEYKINSFKICVLGTDKMYSEFINLSQNKTFNNSVPIVIVRCKTIHDIVPCQLIYVDASQELYVDSIYQKIAKKPILLVAQNLQNYWESMISFVNVDQKHRFIVYRPKMDESGLNVSSSLYSVEAQKQILEEEISQEQKQTNVITEQKSNIESKAVEIDKQRIIIASIALLSFGVVILLFFVIRSNAQRKKANILITQQKAEVEKQKALVEEKNKEILDSITYAKRLQDAILPPLSLVEKILPGSFVLYKPKDIVAGDFYWMEQAGNSILIAAADCTGHGVPGAMVSVVCSNALNRTVKEFGITMPGKILDKVRDLVLQTFEKSENNVQDGMDISLCCIDEKSKEIQWSGAYNSLWYIKNQEMKEVPADKQPIGKHDKPMPFSTHNLNLQEGDIMYLFTDGYADQFGGPKGKKFKYKQLQEKLFAISSKPMSEQKNILEQTLEEWKGNLEQVDDVLIIGIRI